MTGSDADAADAAQEAMISIVRGLPRFDGRSAFTTWAYRITANACIDELRRRARRPEPGLPPVEQPTPAAAPLTDQSVTDRLDLDAALARLPRDHRLVVALRDQLGLGYAEIAAVAGVPVGTVRSRLARARAALADHLGGTRNRRPAATVEESSP